MERSATGAGGAARLGIWPWLGLALLIVVVDQLTKRLILDHYRYGDVTYVTSTNIAASRALLKVGEIDAMTTDMSTTLEQQRKGEERLLFSYGDLVKDFHMQIIFATDKVIAEKPEAVRAFVAAWLETIAFVKANKAKTVEILHQVLGFHPDVLSETYDRVVASYSTDGKFNPRALAVLARSYVELKLLDKEPDMTKLYTEEFLPKSSSKQ